MEGIEGSREEEKKEREKETETSVLYFNYPHSAVDLGTHTCSSLGLNRRNGLFSSPQSNLPGLLRTDILSPPMLISLDASQLILRKNLVCIFNAL